MPEMDSGIFKEDNCSLLCTSADFATFISLSLLLCAISELLNLMGEVYFCITFQQPNVFQHTL